ncbi:MAG: hypothetical protein AB1679_18770 [Actinomycetota bacterium]
MSVQDGSRCASCGRAVRLSQNGPQGRICSACYARDRLEECAACGRHQTPNRRRPDGRALCHTCVRRQDAATEASALRIDIAELVAALEPHLEQDVIVEAIRRAARDLRQTRWLADALAGGPAPLLGTSTGPAVVGRLVAELQTVGALTVTPPTCCRCGTTRRLRERLAGQRICTPCASKLKRSEACSRCGRIQPINNRLPDGTGLCAACRLALTIEECASCGRVAKVARRAADGGGLCGRCVPPRPLVTCSICGRTLPGYGIRNGNPRCQTCAKRRTECARCGHRAMVAVVWPEGPVCTTCRYKTLESRGLCVGCGQVRRIDPRNRNGQALCSDCAGLPPLSVCEECGVEARRYAAGRCFACSLRRRLDQLIGAAPALDGLRTTLAASSSPRACLRWLANAETRQVLGAMAAGDLPLSHEALDDLPPTKSLRHLRHVLVAAGVLPERHDDTASLEAWIDAQLNLMEQAEDRRVLEAFARWWVLRRYRGRVARRGASSMSHARTTIREAIRLMAWLQSHGRTLATCTQADVDLWLAGPPGRRGARDFLRWACRQRLAKDVDIVRRPDPTPGRSADADEQAALARRLLVDDSFPLNIRVAGIMLLCYGQPVARIVRLRLDHVHDDGDTLSITFGRTDVVLPIAIAELVRLLAVHPGRAVTGQSERPQWLFPGQHPGRPLSAGGLEQQLHRYGIEARSARSSVLLDFASEVPPVVLADLLGLHPNTAVRWVQNARGDWAAYAAAKAQR